MGGEAKAAVAEAAEAEAQAEAEAAAEAAAAAAAAAAAEAEVAISRFWFRTLDMGHRARTGSRILRFFGDFTISRIVSIY